MIVGTAVFLALMSIVYFVNLPTVGQTWIWVELKVLFLLGMPLAMLKKTSFRS